MANLTRIGSMTESIGLYRRTLAGDGVGGATASWTLYATVWAHIRPASGGERQEGQRTDATGSFLIVIRNRSDLTEKDSITWITNGDRVLNIRFIRARGPRDLYLELEAEIGVRR